MKFSKNQWNSILKYVLFVNTVITYTYIVCDISAYICVCTAQIRMIDISLSSQPLLITLCWEHPSLLHPCCTPASFLFHSCFFPALPLLHPCSIPASPLLHSCSISVPPLLHSCSTPVQSLLHPCSIPSWVHGSHPRKVDFLTQNLLYCKTAEESRNQNWNFADKKFRMSQNVDSRAVLPGWGWGDLRGEASLFLVSTARSCEDWWAQVSGVLPGLKKMLWWTCASLDLLWGRQDRG